MKRSQAMELIRQKLHEYKDHGNHHQALHILEALENVGMLPPGYMKPISGGPPLIPGDFKNEQGVWCTPGVNEWEPEHP